MRVPVKPLSSYPFYLQPFFWNQRRKYGEVLQAGLLWARADSGFSDSWRDSQIARTVLVLCSSGDGGRPWRELTARICVIV